MTLIDWLVLASTLLFIVIYGSWKTRQSTTIESYFKGDNELKWGAIGLSIMATQASAITFLSTPGQAYESGMGFVQFYFGLPIALVVLSATVIPRYYSMKVFTAYEYLEGRFDLKIRLYTAFLFLLQRGLAAGITIYAPAIVLSTVLGWNLNITNILVGTLVIVYTVSGGTKAVSLTQKWQMAVIMSGMFLAFFLIIYMLPDQWTFTEYLGLAGEMGKMEIIDTSFDPNNRYTIWSGIFGGFFLSMSYFGTDQSQVARYLGGKSIQESRLGMMFNALLKIPMQFFILLVGVMLFVFYQFNQPPAFFNVSTLNKIEQTEHHESVVELEQQYADWWQSKQSLVTDLLEAKSNNDAAATEYIRGQLTVRENQGKEIRSQIKEHIKAADPSLETKDSDYVFISFILKYLPHGIIGLLMAVILSAAMSSTAGELNALASTTVVDFYKRVGVQNASESHYVFVSKMFTVLWGVIAIVFALSAHLVDNLIEAVNILGSLFYGTILGIFLLAFYSKRVSKRSIFPAGIISQITVLILYFTTDTGFLWYNLIGCGLVAVIAWTIEAFSPYQSIEN